MSPIDHAALNEMLTSYYQAFSTLDLRRILPYYLEPCFLTGAQGVGAAPTHAELAALLTPALEGLRARGYVRSELTGLRLFCLSAADTLATGVAVRMHNNGQELERAGVTYLLRRTAAGWKIALLAVHDAANDFQS
jgi:hypothetical protein